MDCIFVSAIKAMAIANRGATTSPKNNIIAYPIKSPMLLFIVAWPFDICINSLDKKIGAIVVIRIEKIISAPTIAQHKTGDILQRPNKN